MWWRDAVIYQIYPRSFQDSDGDGTGDLRGIRERLDHLEDLGVDAFWMSPMYPSPLADGGYDIADFCAVDPRLGTLPDLDDLVSESHRRGIRVLLDLVPAHTSIEHPWFREHPDWYIWADGGPPNNWIAAFGGSAWSRDERTGRWYLHSFYPEQPDLDWRNPEVVRAMQGVVRFWLDCGVDGFRIDAVDRLAKDPELRDDPPAERPFPLPLHPEYARLEHVYSRNRPEVNDALGAIREAAGDALLVGEVYLPTELRRPYLEHLDLVFAFEFLWLPRSADALGELVATLAALDGTAWALSNHDVPRVATRFGEENAGLAALVLLTLPGTAFVYQGDEIGLVDGPGGNPPLDRAGRDGARHPMQWDSSPSGGFTSGAPWLPAVDPEARNVAGQRRDPRSLLSFYKRLIRLRRELGGDFRILYADRDVLAYERGRHAIAINLGDEPRRAPVEGETVVAVGPPAEAGWLAPRAGFCLLSRGG